MPLRETKSDIYHKKCSDIASKTEMSLILDLYDLIKPENETPKEWPTKEFPDNDPAILTTEGRMAHRPCVLMADLVGMASETGGVTLTVKGSDAVQGGAGVETLKSPKTLYTTGSLTTPATGNLMELNLTSPNTPRYVAVEVVGATLASANELIIYKKLVG